MSSFLIIIRPQYLYSVTSPPCRWLHGTVRIQPLGDRKVTPHILLVPLDHWTLIIDHLPASCFLGHLRLGRRGTHRPFQAHRLGHLGRPFRITIWPLTLNVKMRRVRWGVSQRWARVRTHPTDWCRFSVLKCGASFSVSHAHQVTSPPRKKTGASETATLVPSSRVPDHALARVNSAYRSNSLGSAAPALRRSFQSSQKAIYSFTRSASVLSVGCAILTNLPYQVASLTNASITRPTTKPRNCKVKVLINMRSHCCLNGLPTEVGSTATCWLSVACLSPDQEHGLAGPGLVEFGWGPRELGACQGIGDCHGSVWV